MDPVTAISITYDIIDQHGDYFRCGDCDSYYPVGQANISSLIRSKISRAISDFTSEAVLPQDVYDICDSGCKVLIRGDINIVFALDELFGATHDLSDLQAVDMSIVISDLKQTFEMEDIKDPGFE